MNITARLRLSDCSEPVLAMSALCLNPPVSRTPHKTAKIQGSRYCRHQPRRIHAYVVNLQAKTIFFGELTITGMDPEVLVSKPPVAIYRRIR